MRIAVVGGGPGGLYFGRLMKQRRPGWEVVVYERNPPDVTYGFGVTFWGRTLSMLEQTDPETHASILAESISWDGMELRHGGKTLHWPGFGFTGISRKFLLLVLQEHAGSVGVDLRFREEVNPGALDEFDLVVAADGANSAVRRFNPERFGSSEDVGLAKFIWLGTYAPLLNATFSFKQTEAGPFAVHGYPFNEDGMCTFGVEVDEKTWKRAGLDTADPEVELPGASDLRAIAYLEEVFEEDLQGYQLVGNNSKWTSFRTIRNRSWHSGKYVLLGDAAHTAHPSVASGTKMAMEDAIALVSALDACGGAQDGALAEYEQSRRPVIEHTQLRSDLSRKWWETFGRRMGMEAEQLSFSYLTRARAVSYDKMYHRAPDYVAGVMERLSAHSVGSPPVSTLPHRPIHAPLTLGSLRLGNRILDAPPATEAPEATSRDDEIEPPGLIMTDKDRVPQQSHPKCAVFGRRIPSGSAPQDLCLSDNLAVVELANPGQSEPEILPEAVKTLRSHAQSSFILAPLPALLEADTEEVCVQVARELKEAGCDMVLIPSAPAPLMGISEDEAAARAQDARLRLSERLRIELGLVTVLEWDRRYTSAADTALLAGRADLIDLRSRSLAS